MALRRLILDIETAPNLAYVWQAWKQNVSPNMFVENSHIMCYAAKWYGHNHIYTQNNFDTKEDEMMRNLASLLNIADIVITHNGRAFDIPIIRNRCLYYGLPPFSPIKHVDTLLVAKRLFRFELNKLEYIAKYLGVSPKGTHSAFPGFTLWKECLNDNPLAWQEMIAYNKQDVLTLEEVYEKLLPWMEDHPNIMVDSPADPRCPKCGGQVQRRGYYSTNVAMYQRYRCNKCGGWARSRYIDQRKEERINVLANAVN